MDDHTTLGDGDYAALLRGLLDDLSGTSITRLEVRHGALRVAIRRAPGATSVPGAYVEAPAPQEAGRPAHWHTVVAPLTGIFYTQASPDDEPYVHVGSPVEPDHVVGLIEAMKLFNEITADVTGTVRELVVESGTLVEAGQALLYVEPGESHFDPPVEAL